MMGIRRLFIAESKDTRKKDSAWPSGIFDFYTPNIRSRPKAKQSDAIRGFEKSIIRKSKCSTDFKRNDFLKKNEAYPLGALRSLKFAYRKLRISLFVELAV